MRDHYYRFVNQYNRMALHPTGHEYYHLLLTTHSVPPQLQASLFTAQRAIAEAGREGKNPAPAVLSVLLGDNTRFHW